MLFIPLWYTTFLEDGGELVQLDKLFGVVSIYFDVHIISSSSQLNVSRFPSSSEAVKAGKSTF